jgi:phosphatidate cytidylyltransferase
MKKVIERLLIFFIGVPAIVVLVLLLPFYHNLVLNIVVIFFSGMGAVEFSSMLEKKQIKITKIESFILGALAPLAITLNISLGLPVWVILLIIMAGSIWALISRIFSRSSEIENILNKIIGGFSLLIYPGFFMIWLIKMSAWGNPGIILLFLLITFANDSGGWLFGTLLGKNNRGVIAVSPNKSIAGYIGGLFGSVVVVVGALLIFPFLFSNIVPSSSLFIIAIFIAICTGIAASLGDLAESAIKRSSGFDDSGKSMLGRGGVLDSIDSIVVAAPVFYLLYSYFSQ